MRSSKDRQYNYEYLRIFAMLQVILFHVIGGMAEQHNPMRDMNNKIGNFLYVTNATCVPLFVMLSGAFLLKSSATINPISFYKKSFRKILIPTLLWSVIYVVFNYIFFYFRQRYLGESQDFNHILLGWLKGSPYYHLWYMYMIIGLYLSIPFLTNIFKNTSNINIFIFGIVFYIAGYFLNNLSLIWPFWFLKFIGYFILGYSLRTFSIRYSFPSILSFFLAFSVGISIWMVTENQIIRTEPPIWFNYHSPLVLLQTSSLFIGFSNLKTSLFVCNIEKLSHLSFQVYFVHAGVLTVLHQISDKFFNSSLGFLLIGIEFMSTFILSVLIASVIDKYSNLFFPKKAVLYIQKYI